MKVGTDHQTLGDRIRIHCVETHSKDGVVLVDKRYCPPKPAPRTSNSLLCCPSLPFVHDAKARRQKRCGLGVRGPESDVFTPLSRITDCSLKPPQHQTSTYGSTDIGSQTHLILGGYKVQRLFNTKQKYPNDLQDLQRLLSV